MEIKSISLIGTGNVAWHLGKAFLAAGIEIKHVAGREHAKVKELAAALKAGSSGAITEPVADADAYLIAVKDDAIREVAEKINAPGRLLIHHAGAANTDILNFGNNEFGVIWPIQTLIRENDVDLHNTLIVVSGSTKEVQEALCNLAGKITDRLVSVSEEQRTVLHLSAVWINNFVNHMFDIANNLLKENDLSMELFFPIIEEHLEQLKHNSPDQLQTGPAKRADLATQKRHKSVLSK
ncbi:MAG: DUF2520 domain-containing protein, partial [Chitinophagales bacterium]